MKFFGKLAALLVGVVSASSAHALSITSLDIDVDPSSPGIQTSLVVAVGSTFTVDVLINGVSGLYTYDIDVDHNPSVLTATSVTEGSFLVNVSDPSFGTLFLSDNSSNPVNVISSLISVPTGASGSGVLFSIQYTAGAIGLSSLQFTFADLADDQFPDPQTIPVSVNGASITVQGVPLPSTLLLLGIGLAAVAGTRRRVG